jgi:hypothetical protein
VTTVALLDGRQVDSASEEWRWECLARAVLAMQPLAKRREFLQDWQKRHGEASADRLRELMKSQHDTKERP